MKQTISCVVMIIAAIVMVVSAIASGCICEEEA